MRRLGAAAAAPPLPAGAQAPRRVADEADGLGVDGAPPRWVVDAAPAG